MRLQVTPENAEVLAAIAQVTGLSQTRALNRLIEDLGGDYLVWLRTQSRPRVVAGHASPQPNVDPPMIQPETKVVQLPTPQAPPADPVVARLSGLLEQF